MHWLYALTRSELGSGVTVEAKQADDPTPLSTVGLEQLQHFGVCAAWPLGESPAHHIWDVKVAHWYCVGITECVGER